MSVVSFATRETLKAASEPQIDWQKVPQGTPVKVWDSTCSDYTLGQFVRQSELGDNEFLIRDWESPVYTSWSYCLLDVPPKPEWNKNNANHTN